MENPESWASQSQLRFTPSTVIFSFLVFWLPGWALSSDPRPEDCEPRHCGNDLNVSYPFWIRGLQNPYCGFPGYGITCKGDAPFLDVDGAELYRVDHIFYDNMSVVVDEPRRSPCPYPRHNLSFPRTLFNVSFVNRELFFYLNCTERLPGTRVIQCAENREGKVSLVSGRPVPAEANASLSCESVISSPFLAHGAVDYGSYESLLGNGFLLEWTAPSCSRCSDSGGRCGYNRTSNEFMCICRDRVQRVRCDSRGDHSSVRLLLLFSLLIDVMAHKAWNLTHPLRLVFAPIIYIITCFPLNV